MAWGNVNIGGVPMEDLDAIRAIATAAQATAEAAQETANRAVTQEQMNAAIQSAVLDSWEGSY